MKRSKFTEEQIAYVLRQAEPTPGIDSVIFTADVASSGPDGVIVTLSIPAGAAITAGETWTKFLPGDIGLPGRFTLSLSQDLNNPANSGIVTIGTSGNFTVSSVGQFTDGSFVANFSFSVGNGAGGTIVGSGVGKWR